MVILNDENFRKKLFSDLFMKIKIKIYQKNPLIKS